MQSKNLDHDYVIKLILIGDSGVGKTSLISRFVDNVFETSYVTTIGVDFKLKTILLPSTPSFPQSSTQHSNAKDNTSASANQKRIKLHIWDTTGQERYRAITSSFYRNAHGVIAVYDASNRASFENLNGWLQQVDNITTGKTLPRIVIGNKYDLDVKVTREQAKIWSAGHGGISCFCTSAKPLEPDLIDSTTDSTRKKFNDFAIDLELAFLDITNKSLANLERPCSEKYPLLLPTSNLDQNKGCSSSCCN